MKYAPSPKFLCLQNMAEKRDAWKRLACKVGFNGPEKFPLGKPVRAHTCVTSAHGMEGVSQNRIITV